MNDSKIQTNSLPRIWDEIWRNLALGAESPAHPWHSASLATVDEASPKNRTVILRMVDKRKKVLICHSDIRARKIDQIRRNAAVSWSFWDPEQSIQLRIEGQASIYHLDPTARAAWDNLAATSRFHYSQPWQPGTEIPDPSAADVPMAPNPDAPSDLTDLWYKRFAMIECKIQNADWLCLSRTGHRRASFTIQDEELSMNWLVP